MDIERIKIVVEEAAKESGKTAVIEPLRKAIEEFSRARKAETKALDKIEAILVNLQTPSA